MQRFFAALSDELNDKCRTCCTETWKHTQLVAGTESSIFRELGRRNYIACFTQPKYAEIWSSC